MGYPGVQRLFMQQSCSIHVPSTLDIYNAGTQSQTFAYLFEYWCCCTRSQNISLLEVHCSNHVTRSICYHNNVVPYFCQFSQFCSSGRLIHTFRSLTFCTISIYIYTHGCEIQQRSALQYTLRTLSLRTQQQSITIARLLTLLHSNVQGAETLRLELVYSATQCPDFSNLRLTSTASCDSTLHS